MDFIFYIIFLFVIIICIGQIFNKSLIPLPLILVITGMLLSFIPNMPLFTLSPYVVLNIFLPLIIYETTAYSAWKDYIKNMRPVVVLSIGHVFFITFLVAAVFHFLIPQMSWPMAILLGAIVAPPDSVAIVAISEKVHMPARLVTILKGEGLFNDATALILFRFALAAILTSQFSLLTATATFFIDVIGEFFYGLLVGFVIGHLRTKIIDPKIQIIASILTPFLAYLPPETLGGTGVIATAVTGFYIGTFKLRFQPEFRVAAGSLWPALTFIIQSLIFLIVGLNLHAIIASILVIPPATLLLYSCTIVFTVIVGRFIWVYGTLAFIPYFLFSFLRKNKASLPWQFPFIISWTGIRGGVSLAAAFAIPTLPIFIDGANPKNLLTYLVFCVIFATLVLQGLLLPWILKTIGVYRYGLCEQYSEHISELSARLQMVTAVLHWLYKTKKDHVKDSNFCSELNIYIKQYRLDKKNLTSAIKNHSFSMNHDEALEAKKEKYLMSQILEVERSELSKMWHTGKISFSIRDKLLIHLDFRSKHLMS